MISSGATGGAAGEVVVLLAGDEFEGVARSADGVRLAELCFLEPFRAVHGGSPVVFKRCGVSGIVTPPPGCSLDAGEALERRSTVCVRRR